MTVPVVTKNNKETKFQKTLEDRIELHPFTKFFRIDELKV